MRRLVRMVCAEDEERKRTAHTIGRVVDKLVRSVESQHASMVGSAGAAPKVVGAFSRARGGATNGHTTSSSSSRRASAPASSSSSSPSTQPPPSPATQPWAAGAAAAGGESGCRCQCCGKWFPTGVQLGGHRRHGCAKLVRRPGHATVDDDDDLRTFLSCRRHAHDGWLTPRCTVTQVPRGSSSSSAAAAAAAGMADAYKSVYMPSMLWASEAAGRAKQHAAASSDPVVTSKPAPPTELPSNDDVDSTSAEAAPAWLSGSASKLTERQDDQQQQQQQQQPPPHPPPQQQQQKREAQLQQHQLQLQLEQLQQQERIRRSSSLYGTVAVQLDPPPAMETATVMVDGVGPLQPRLWAGQRPAPATSNRNPGAPDGQLPGGGWMGGGGGGGGLGEGASGTSTLYSDYSDLCAAFFLSFNPAVPVAGACVLTAR
jgi:hypothetical protein